MPYFTSDGTNIHVEISGTGMPLLMLHELTLDHRQWTAQKEALRGERKVFRMDFRGHGRSARPASGHSWTGLAADVQRGLVQFGMDRLNPGVIVAHGHACDVALQVAIAEPRRIRSLLLVTPILWGAPLSTEWRDLLRAVRRSVEADELEEAMNLLRQDSSFSGVRSNADLLRVVKEMQQGFSGLLPLQEEEQSRATFERLGECTTPTLVLSATGDRGDFKEIAATLGQRLPAARLHACDGVAHFPNLEAPEEFNRIVLDWLQDSAPRS